MNIVLNDLNTQLLTRALLEPGEQLTGKVMGRREPWYTRFLKLDALMPYVLFVATDRRLIMLVHEKRMFASGYELAAVEWAPWSDVEELAAKGLLAKNKLRFAGRTQRGPQRLTVKLPMFRAPLRNNGKELGAVVSTFQSRRSLPPGQAAPMLPSSVPPPPHGYASASHAPQGYAPQSYGQQAAAPYAPPPGYGASGPNSYGRS